ncbi:MAG: fatty acid desaturase [Byssovorax sp.]
MSEAAPTEAVAQEARGIARDFEAELRDDPTAQRRARLAGLRLAIEWLSILAVTYALIYAVRPAFLKLALLIPWSIYASLSLDNITHYANHWPLFQGTFANRLWRASGVLVLFNPLEIRAIHNDHHRAYSRPDNDERVFGPEQRGRSFARYLLVESLDGLRVLVPWRAMAPPVVALAARRPEHLREILVIRWAFLGWFLALVAVDWRDTLLYFVPFVVLVGSFASLVMNLTDHIPGDSHHPFRFATYLDPATRREELFSAINHQTCATHLTHHLFPKVHWIHLRALQQRLLPVYRRNGAPRSLIVNSTLAGNPVALLRVLRELSRRRFDLA